MSVSVLRGKLVFSVSGRLERSELLIKFPAGIVADARARVVIAEAGAGNSKLAPLGGTARIKSGGEIWDVVKDGNFAHIAVPESGKAAKPSLSGYIRSSAKAFPNW